MQAIIDVDMQAGMDKGGNQGAEAARQADAGTQASRYEGTGISQAAAQR
jgi:hypothetical protein